MNKKYENKLGLFSDSCLTDFIIFFLSIEHTCKLVEVFRCVCEDVMSTQTCQGMIERMLEGQHLPVK